MKSGSPPGKAQKPAEVMAEGTDDTEGGGQVPAMAPRSTVLTGARVCPFASGRKAPEESEGLLLTCVGSRAEGRKGGRQCHENASLAPHCGKATVDTPPWCPEPPPCS